jgi:hypothetical protein
MDEFANVESVGLVLGTKKKRQTIEVCVRALLKVNRVSEYINSPKNSHCIAFILHTPNQSMIDELNPNPDTSNHRI